MVAFSPKGISPQMKGVEPNITVPDNVLEASIQKFYSDPVRMEDRKKVYGDRIVDAFPDMDPNVLNWKPLDKPFATEQTLKALKNLNLKQEPVCSRLPGDPTFNEEDDCLLTMAIKYMPYYLDLLSKQNI
jgi:hypothetical protein